jgi:hypothetical protein
MAAPRNAETIRRDIERERDDLATAVEHLRGELSEATDVSAKVRAHLPMVVAGAAGTGFVLAGGLGATLRYLARRGREGHERAHVGRWSLLARD